MKTVAYSSPFVPAEWIAAHRLKPIRLTPLNEISGYEREGVCPYAEAFVECAMNLGTDSVVMTTTCDQMRRLSDFFPAEIFVHLMTVPSTWTTRTANSLYLSEIKRLGLFLESIGGVGPDDDYLRETMLSFDKARSELIDSQASLSSKEFSISCVEFHRKGVPTRGGLARIHKKSNSKASVALFGGPMLESNLILFDLVEKHGGTVVLDGTETGIRTLPAPFDRRRIESEPLAVLGETYFNTIPDIFQRPNNRLYQWLDARIAEMKIDGVILLTHTWCDLWNAEITRLKEWCEVPILALDGDFSGSESTLARTETRIEAFLGML